MIKALARMSKALGLSKTIVESTTREMSQDKFHNKNKEWGPFRPLPNVSDFQLEIADYDELFLEHGIKKTLESRKFWKPYRNKRLNHYMLHQIRRLNKARDTGNEKLYWVLANQILQRSNVFALSAIATVFPRYHRDFPYLSVLRWVWGSHAIARDPKAIMEYKRVYIEKANGKKRPLGVPSPAWRIYLHLLGKILVHRLAGKMNKHQHGFIPGRGTLTAWIDIFSSVVDSPDIYEYDFKGFFDSIRIDYLSRRLLEFGLPEAIVERIQSINKAPPILPAVLELDETNALVKETRLTSEERIARDGADYMHLDFFSLFSGTGMVPDMNMPEYVPMQWELDEDEFQEEYQPPKEKVYRRWAINVPAYTEAGYGAEELSDEERLKVDEYISAQDPDDKRLVVYPGPKGSQGVDKWGVPMKGRDPFGNPEGQEPPVAPPVVEVKPRPSRTSSEVSDLYQAVLSGAADGPGIGVAQGSPTSPFLANIPMLDYIRSCWTNSLVVAYADDFLKVSRPLTIKRGGVSTKFWRPLPAEEFLLQRTNEMEEMGLEYAPSKCGFVRRNGVWLKPLKFLGLEYDGPTDRLYASTRNGSRLELKDKEALIDAFLSSEGGKTSSPGQDSKRSWVKFLTSKIAGFMQTRLYAGEWNQKAFTQSFEFKWKKGSWAHFVTEEANLSDRLHLNVFNSTSVAANMILNHIRAINRQRFLKREWKGGRLTFDEYNRRRKEMGLPALSPYATKSIQLAKNAVKPT